MPDRTPITGGNWKMNLDLATACELADDVVAGCGDLPQTCDVAVFPPFPYLQAVGRTLVHSGVLLGAQDVYFEPDGAFTGEVSVDMLADLNVGIVLAGHSERRHVIGEDDELVNAKTRAAVEGGLQVVLCVGETLEQRRNGQTDAVNERQITAGLEGIGERQMNRVVIAYEPVWAIGTGETASPEDAEQAHAAIRSVLARVYDDAVAETVRIQYGGSVKPANAADLFRQPNIDGGLIGGASLKADDFVAIVRASRVHDDA